MKTQNLHNEHELILKFDCLLHFFIYWLRMAISWYKVAIESQDIITAPITLPMFNNNLLGMLFLLVLGVSHQISLPQKMLDVSHVMSCYNGWIIFSLWSTIISFCNFVEPLQTTGLYSKYFKIDQWIYNVIGYFDLQFYVNYTSSWCRVCKESNIKQFC